MADLEEFFKEQIKPYEERIKKLEELDKKKDVEITLLKGAIEHMKAEIEKLKAQLEKNKLIGPSTGAKTGTKLVPNSGKLSQMNTVLIPLEHITEIQIYN